MSSPAVHQPKEYPLRMPLLQGRVSRSWREGKGGWREARASWREARISWREARRNGGEATASLASKLPRNAAGLKEKETFREALDRNNNILHISDHLDAPLAPRTSQPALHNLLRRRLSELCSYRVTLLEENKRNCETGRLLCNCLGDVGTLTEVSKLCLHLAEVESLTKLLLSLASRLARTEARLETQLRPPEKEELTRKQGVLTDQLREAQELARHHGRREAALEMVLDKYFDKGLVLLFRTSIDQKVALLTQLKEVTDLIKLLEEQLSRLKYCNKRTTE